MRVISVYRLQKMHMTSAFVQFFENVNLSSSYDGLTRHQILFNLDQAKQSYGGGGADSAPLQVENVLNHPGEIGLRAFQVHKITE